jgi:hypothetical protein
MKYPLRSLELTREFLVPVIGSFVAASSRQPDHDSRKGEHAHQNHSDMHCAQQSDTPEEFVGH